MRSILTRRGQTTIPKAIRDQLRLEAGAGLDWTLEADGTVTLRSENPFLASLGAFPLPAGLTTETFMEDLRGPREPEARGGPGANIVSLDEVLKLAHTLSAASKP
ncbi:AbrB/MazE/SpoVT family DNA-binding domain-containing protein [Deinococcus sp.]|uniref:AbrB/MazE/SpoVT family DNA-binding domain-containing protein n=1 Tax=Deinococcus sp. TaxID=47478 RepID=UPI003B5C4009